MPFGGLFIEVGKIYPLQRKFAFFGFGQNSEKKNCPEQRFC